MVKAREEAVKILDKATQGQPVSDYISSDSRYVPLQLSEDEVCKALQNPLGPAVVLLHGGPGKGKSTLARQMVVKYNDAKENPKFELVFFLSCGPEAKVDVTLVELVQCLGCTPEVTSKDGKESQLFRIQHQVKHLLATRNILLILDDVIDGEFLERIVELFGSGVKCLVTSQLESLCQRQYHSKFMKIQIQDIGIDDARKILASHIGTPNQQIPQHVQVLADRMISETDFNPLEIASLANMIDVDRANDLSEWEDASTIFFKSLKIEVIAVFQHRYPKSFWATMGQAISTLNKNVLNLLLLTHAFERLTIPEEVVRLIYKCSKFPGPSEIFSRVRQGLKTRGLIRISFQNPSVSSDNISREISWSVHSLQQRYIVEEMRKDRESLIMSLIHKDSVAAGSMEGNVVTSGVSQIKDMEDKMITAVCALYLDKELAERASSMLGIPHHNFNYFRRNAIEPLTLLQGRPISDQWPEAARMHAIKVFEAYINKGALDDEGISFLLVHQISSPVMCRALKGIALIVDSEVEKGHLVDESTSCYMKALVDQLGEEVEHCMQQANLATGDVHTKAQIVNYSGLLSELVNFLAKDTNPGVQEEVARALAALVDGEESPFIGSFPGVWEGIVRLLGLSSDISVQRLCAGEILVGMPWLLDSLFNSVCNDDNRSLQGHAAAALANLVAFVPNNLLLRIVHHSQLLSGLVTSWSKDANPTLQHYVSLALANLASKDVSTKAQIVHHTGLLSTLVNSLAKDDNPGLQKEVARALASLANGDDNTKAQIVNYNGLLSQLVNSLAKDTNPGVQKEVARTLASLANGDVNTKAQIVNSSGLLSELMNSLAKDANPDLQKEVARALVSLANGDVNTKAQIVNYSGLLSELMNSLAKDANPGLQKEVARALASLAIGDVNTKLQIANYNGLLSELVNSLAKDTNLGLQEAAARALINLINGDDSIKAEIVNNTGLLSQLLKSLSKAGSAVLQENAARVFGNLALGDDKTKEEIVNYTGVLPDLVDSLSEDAKPALQEAAARAFVNLAHGDTRTQAHIVNCPRVLSELVKSLCKEANPSLQKYAAWALATLASGHVDTKAQIVSHGGLLSELAFSLSKDTNPVLQAEAARVIASLAVGDGKTKEKIVNHSGVILELVHSLAKDANPGLQEQASRALVNLVVGDENIKMQIVNIVSMKEKESLVDGLLHLLRDHAQSFTTYHPAMSVLTHLDPAVGNAQHLQCGSAYKRRAHVNARLGMYNEAMFDINKAHELNPGNSYILSFRCSVRAKRGQEEDFKGALEDANEVVNGCINVEGGGNLVFGLQERGVLKQMMGDFPGALADLKEGLVLDTDDYELRKHIAYVKFRMKDEKGAREDAAWANRIKPNRVEYSDYGQSWWLGVTSVEFLEYKLR